MEVINDENRESPRESNQETPRFKKKLTWVYTLMCPQKMNN